MGSQQNQWEAWAKFFLARTDRALPALIQDQDYDNLPDSLARSLAIFQLGESGGGTIIQQAWQNDLPDVDEYYAAAMVLFVEEEHRHANILGMCVRLLGGSLIRNNWTARLFVFARRLMGLRLKVVVLLAAEVVGICYYHLLATHLPDSRLRSQILEIVEDERSHLYFHCEFLRSQTQTVWRKRIFVVVWRSVMLCAAVVVAIDHRRAIRDLDIGLRKVIRRWFAYTQLAEKLVVLKSSNGQVNRRIQPGVQRPMRQ